jgi:outer membrane lipoprotein SlyB
MNMDFKRIALFISISLFVPGCAGTPVGGSDKPTVPNSGDARKACPTTTGVVINVTEVTIQGNVEAAQGVGAAIGGYAGHEAAGDNDVAKVFGAVAGAAVGTYAGNAVGNATLNKSGQELVILVGDTSYTILQETDVRMGFSSGDTVYVIGNLSSRNYYNRGSNTNCTNGIRVIKKGA